MNTDNLTVLGEGGYGRVVKVGKKEGFSREMAVKVVVRCVCVCVWVWGRVGVHAHASLWGLHYTC